MVTAYGTSWTEAPACRALSVLLVEDSRATRNIVASMLRRRGHSVTLAEGGAQLLDTYVVGHFDVILMDIEMPDMDGYETAAAIRRMEKQPGARIPIVALTAHVMEDDRRKCLDSGMDAFLSKPIDVEQLIAMLEGGTFRRRGDAVATTLSGDGTDADAAKTVVDMAAMMRRLGGDAELLQRFIEVFEEDAPRLFESIRAAATAGDEARLRRSAHALRGLAANFDAKLVVKIVARLERTGIDEPLENVVALPAKLAEELTRVTDTLSHYRMT